MTEWNYPHEFHDGTDEVASGVQVDENFTRAREKIEEGRSRAMLTSGFSFVPEASVTPNAPHEGSSTKAAWVMLSFSSPSSPPVLEAQVWCNGAKLARVALVAETAQRFFTFAFPCPPGGKWELVAAGGWELNVSYALFG